MGARVGHIDVTLARLGSGAGDEWLSPVSEPPDNERFRRARHLRSDVQLAGRREISMEIRSESDRNSGLGTRLVQAAVARMSTDEAIFASVAPGNTRSLRCLLRAGFVPIGAECVLILSPASMNRLAPTSPADRGIRPGPDLRQRWVDRHVVRRSWTGLEHRRQAGRRDLDQ